MVLLYCIFQEILWDALRGNLLRKDIRNLTRIYAILQENEENSERLGGRPRLGSNTSPAVFQFQGQNLSATGGAKYFRI